MTNLRGGEGGYDHIPLRRPGTPDDLANLIAFLTTDASSYINGAVIPIDGRLECGCGVASNRGMHSRSDTGGDRWERRCQP